jgi:hypothetical protein
MKLQGESFRLSDDPEGQLLLALVLVAGSRPGVTASDLWQRLRPGRRRLHASIEYEWESSYFVSLVLGRLRRRGLVRGGRPGVGEEPVWRATQQGQDWLCGRLLPERDRPAA